MTLYDGLFTTVLDGIKTYLEAVDGGSRYPKVFFGPIAESVFFSLNSPAVSIQFNNATETGMRTEWMMDVSVVYMMYDPSFTDDYDVIDNAEVLMDDIHDHLEAQNAAGLGMYGDVTGCNTYRFDHEDSYVFMWEVKLSIRRKEADSS